MINDRWAEDYLQLDWELLSSLQLISLMAGLQLMEWLERGALRLQLLPQRQVERSILHLRGVWTSATLE
jgi:hypothetical protein